MSLFGVRRTTVGDDVSDRALRVSFRLSRVVLPVESLAQRRTTVAPTGRTILRFAIPLSTFTRNVSIFTLSSLRSSLTDHDTVTTLSLHTYDVSLFGARRTTSGDEVSACSWRASTTLSRVVLPAESRAQRRTTVVPTERTILRFAIPLSTFTRNVSIFTLSSLRSSLTDHDTVTTLSFHTYDVSLFGTRSATVGGVVSGRTSRVNSRLSRTVLPAESRAQRRTIVVPTGRVSTCVATPPSTSTRNVSIFTLSSLRSSLTDHDTVATLSFHAYVVSRFGLRRDAVGAIQSGGGARRTEMVPVDEIRPSTETTFTSTGCVPIAHPSDFGRTVDTFTDVVSQLLPPSTLHRWRSTRNVVSFDVVSAISVTTESVIMAIAKPERTKTEAVDDAPITMVERSVLAPAATRTPVIVVERPSFAISTTTAPSLGTSARRNIPSASVTTSRAPPTVRTTAPETALPSRPTTLPTTVPPRWSMRSRTPCNVSSAARTVSRKPYPRPWIAANRRTRPGSTLARVNLPSFPDVVVAVWLSIEMPASARTTPSESTTTPFAVAYR